MKILLFISCLFTFTAHSQNCSDVFWTINTSQQIREWCFDNQVVTGGNTILTVPGGITGSLSYCNDGTINTFFCFGASTNVQKYDGTSQWINIPVGTVGGDNGGFGIHQYFRDFNTNTFYYYNGGSPSVIATDCYMKVADVGVDSQGRGWIFTGSVANNNIADTLKVYDKANGLVASYPLNFDSLNSYGSFFINNNLYIMKGQFASTSPNTIIPVNIVNGNASLGQPIAFSCPACADAASANFNFLSQENFEFDTSIVVYPNPAFDSITINSNLTILEVLIYDLTGRLIQSVKSEKNIDVSKLQNQVYVLKAVTTDGIVNKLFEKK